MRYITLEESQYYIKLPTEKKHRADVYTYVPDNDGWEKVQYLANAILDPSGAVRPTEYVYVLVNKSVPNIVKIGMTKETPDKRAKQISAATGIPTPWIPVYSLACYRSDLLEEEVHEYFKQYRVNRNREMFSIDSYTAQEVIERLGFKYTTSNIY